MPTVNRSVMIIAEAHSHHWRLSILRTRVQKDGSFGGRHFTAKLKCVTML